MSSSDEAKKRPNLLIFQPDQLRYDALGCNDNPLIKTPNIDKLAARGTRFTNCFVQASVCSQSRCSMFTGCYPHTTGHRSLDNLIKPHEPNFFRSLKENGYHVAYLGPRGDTFAADVTELSVTEYGFLEEPTFMPKFNKNRDAVPSEEIMDRLYYKGLCPPEEAMDYDEALTRSAVAWLDSVPPEPFCLFMPLLYPHCPWKVEEPYFSMYDRSTMPAPIDPVHKTGHEPAHMPKLREAYGTHRASLAHWQEIKAVYYGMCSRMDAQFGRVMHALDKQGLTEDTVIAFFTDHGEWMGDHGLIEKWPSGLSDSLVHEPLILAGPGIPVGQVFDDMTEMVDFMPTMFELCGVPESFPHNGKSLLEAIQGRATASHRHYSFSEGGFLMSEEFLLENGAFPYDKKGQLQHSDTKAVGKSISVRNKEWTYVYRIYEQAELYSRLRDPGEVHNLSGLPEYAHVEASMREVILKWMVETSDLLPWQRDARFPQVKLVSPKEQARRRLEAARAAK